MQPAQLWRLARILKQTLVLIWVQTVCKVYQQMTKVATSKERVNSVQQLGGPQSVEDL